MGRLSLFNSPLLLGFDHVERVLDRVAKSSSDGYPPFDIEQIGDQGLRITLALAGFSISDLSIQIEDGQLVIRGKQTDDAERTYLHRGIAARQFQRSFLLAEGIEVTGAFLDRGLLQIDLLRAAPTGKSHEVTIGAPSGGAAGKVRSRIGAGHASSREKQSAVQLRMAETGMTDAVPTANLEPRPE